jgi:photosystem II stability/assembly factor-like uncharacterized protein
VKRIASRVLRPLIAVAALLALWPASALAVLSYPVNAVSFHDAGSGFLAGGSGSSGFVSATGDGGATWHATVATNQFMYGVAASLDSAAAMAVGDFDGARVTADSGSTWAAEAPLLSRVGTKIYSAAYLSGGRRVAVGKVESPMNYAVIASAVGAGAWDVDLEGPKYPLPADENDPPQTITNAELRAVDAAPGGTVAWAVGTNLSEYPQSATGEALIYKWTDSSSTWATQTVTGVHTVTSVTAADDNTAFIGCSSKKVLRTMNGGSTWAALSAPTAIAINAIDALDANTIVVVGDAGKVAWTTNASAGTPTWTAPVTIAGGNALLGVKVIDASHWVVVGDKETILRTSDGGATWAGSTAAAAPTASITTPTADSLLSVSPLVARGTASDGFGVGVAKVEVRLQRADGQYWTGSAWSASEVWLPASPAGDEGLNTWEAAVLSDTSTLGGAATLSARATDGLGLVGAAKDVAALNPTAIVPYATSVISAYNAYVAIGGRLTSSGNSLAGKPVRLLSSGGAYLGATTTGADGGFRFNVKPASASDYVFSFLGDAGYAAASSAQVKVSPKAYVGTPVVPSKVKRNKYFKAYADLKPKHTVGSWSAKFYFERYQRLSNGKLGWARLKTVSAKAATRLSYSRCTVSVKLAKGKWRVQAMHSDAGHATSYSGWRGFTVR